VQGAKSRRRDPFQFSQCVHPTSVSSLSRLAPDHHPIAELIGGAPPLQQAETLADRGTNAIGADNKIRAT